MGQPFIVLGDQTDHGGVVVGASGTSDTHGRKIARVGDQVTCPKKGHGTTVIVSGDPTMIIDGAAAARHGDKCACGATLISGQVVSTTAGGGGSIAAGVSLTQRTTPAVEHSEMTGCAAAGYDQSFQLTDELTGQPLVGWRYRLSWSGSEVVGVTDDQGCTKRVSAAHPADVSISVLGLVE